MTSTANGSKMRARSSEMQQSLELEQLLAQMQSKVHWDSKRRALILLWWDNEVMDGEWQLGRVSNQIH